MLGPFFRELIYTLESKASMRNPWITKIVTITEILTLTKIVIPFFLHENVTIMSEVSIYYNFRSCEIGLFQAFFRTFRFAIIYCFSNLLLISSENCEWFKIKLKFQLEKFSYHTGHKISKFWFNFKSVLFSKSNFRPVLISDISQNLILIRKFVNF